MGKFDKEELVRLTALESPASAGLAPADPLRALVKFAISQGYYERWNKSADLDVRSCSSTDFPTDRG